MVKPVANLGARAVGDGQPCFVIAEVGVNHNGDIALAKKLIDAAAAAGADAVKFQAFRTEKLTTKAAPKALYQLAGTGSEESQFEMLKRLELSSESNRELMTYSRSRGVEFLSTPFDEASADELLELGVGVLKLPSGELTNLPFLTHVAKRRVPVILSTGMASLDEVAAAVEIFHRHESREFVLLHCVSSYPATAADCNLRAMQTMKDAFSVPVGFSDHTIGTDVALAAVALGACLIEKHLTLDQQLPGPDHKASAEPDVFAALVRGIRLVEAALGDGAKERRPAEQNTAEAARRSIVAEVDIPAGAVIAAEMLVLRRPGTGLAPARLPEITGRAARRSIAAGDIISMEMLQ